MTERFITQEGLEKIRTELENRKTTVRQEIAGAIKEAKEQGDLSENAEYSSARQRQSENEARIAELEAMVKTMKVVESAGDASCVGFGSVLEAKTPNGKTMKFHIVGTNEVDPALGKISNESPLGKAFIGKCEGDTAQVETPVGKAEYTIISVK
jgi:transcription elongation factor GreA